MRRMRMMEEGKNGWTGIKGKGYASFPSLAIPKFSFISLLNRNCVAVANFEIKKGFGE